MRHNNKHGAIKEATGQAIKRWEGSPDFPGQKLQDLIRIFTIRLEQEGYRITRMPCTHDWVLIGETVSSGMWCKLCGKDDDNS